MDAQQLRQPALSRKENGLSFLREYVLFLKTQKKLWLLPLFVIVWAFSGLAALGQGGVMAPFIYALF